jgi:hypothetical protein
MSKRKRRALRTKSPLQTLKKDRLKVEGTSIKKSRFRAFISHGVTTGVLFTILGTILGVFGQSGTKHSNGKTPCQNS